MTDVRQDARLTPGGKPKPGTRVIVDVYADGAPGAVSWSHHWRFEDHSLNGNGGIDVPAKKAGEDPTPIKFNLHDRTQPKVGLKFVDDDNAIWSDRNSCPERDASWDPEITSIRPAGLVMHVVDLNEVDCTLHYNLRFTPDPESNYYDPDIRNGGTT